MQKLKGGVFFRNVRMYVVFEPQIASAASALARPGVLPHRPSHTIESQLVRNSHVLELNNIKLYIILPYHFLHLSLWLSPIISVTTSLHLMPLRGPGRKGRLCWEVKYKWKNDAAQGIPYI